MKIFAGSTVVLLSMLGCTTVAMAAEKMASPASAVPAATAPAATEKPAAATPEPAPAPTATEPAKPKMLHLQAGKPRSKNMDLRHCLKLKTNAAIAKCAGE